MAKKLVIVESPTKAKTIAKFLGKDFEVTSSYGHIRDLPSSAKEIPAKVKKEPWSRLGINVDKDFKPLYVISADKKKKIKELKNLLKDCDELYLSTDEDREGESISWHLLEVLKPKITVKRMAFHEITKSAITEALNNSRDVDMNLVKAQETRRLVDRLYGYSISPLLWKKMAPRLSAGRVQSVALRLIVQRERERISFVSAVYWDLKAKYAKDKQEFNAEMIAFKDKKIAIGKDFDPKTGKLKNDKVHLLDAAAAKELKKQLDSTEAVVKEIQNKPYATKPPAPFVTSSLQQEASRKLRYTAQRTMGIAQRLYENGFITYMRTDSTTLSKEALEGARKFIASDFGKEFLPDQPRIYKTKVKNAQEAHEAIRPAGQDFADVETVKKTIDEDAARLYDLIWKRTLACQMKDAKGMRQTVQITHGDATFRASGKTIEFPGFLRAYVEGSDDPAAELADQENILPKMSEKDTLGCNSLEALEHNTQPPARYTEGSLIKELETRGIGRPSTWASVVNLILSKNYVFKKGTALVPSFLSQALVGLLEDYFTNLVDYSFTAKLEDDLDAISRGEADSLEYLNNFYFGNGHPGVKTLVESGEENIDPRIVNGLKIGENEKGETVEVRIGRYGPFISDGEIRASLPERLAPYSLDMEMAKEMLAIAAKGPESLGKDPKTGLDVFIRNGRYGPYLQLGEKTDDNKKPEMAGFLANQNPEEVTLEMALKLFELPRNLGPHPDTKEDIFAMNGPHGPYLKSGTDTRPIDLEQMSPLTITLKEALELYSQPRKRRRAGSANIKEVGEHPISKKKVVVKNGRFGPYVTDGKINASIPKGMMPEEVTMDDAVNLLEARAAKMK